jgi:hypothetical protein
MRRAYTGYIQGEVGGSNATGCWTRQVAGASPALSKITKCPTCKGGLMSREIDATIKSVTDLIYKLYSDPVDRQVQAKRINLLWNRLEKLSTPRVLSPYCAQKANCEECSKHYLAQAISQYKDSLVGEIEGLEGLYLEGVKETDIRKMIDDGVTLDANPEYWIKRSDVLAILEEEPFRLVVGPNQKKQLLKMGYQESELLESRMIPVSVEDAIHDAIWSSEAYLFSEYLIKRIMPIVNQALSTQQAQIREEVEGLLRKRYLKLDKQRRLEKDHEEKLVLTGRMTEIVDIKPDVLAIIEEERCQK